jgi:hypothetical protein
LLSLSKRLALGEQKHVMDNENEDYYNQIVAESGHDIEATDNRYFLNEAEHLVFHFVL